MFKQFHYSLGLKFSLAVGGLLVVFCALLSISLYQYLKSRAVQDAKDKTQIIMTQTKSIGSYVRDVLRPKMYEMLRKTKSEEEFIIEAMSTTHVTHQVMRRFNSELPDYQFRRTSDFPLNSANKANAFEVRMLRYFSENPTVPLWQGLERAGDREMLISVRPVVSDASCLWCHGSATQVPKAVKQLYGDGAMFWEPGDKVIGVESVSIPLDVAFAQVRQFALDTFLFGLLALVGLFVGLFVTFRQLVTKPLNSLSKTFRDIAGGSEQLSARQPSERADEIGALNNSFNELARHLSEAQEKLKKSAALEKQMMQAEKMAALGQLSAGVAHEVNNPLGGIKLCFNNLMTTDMDEQVRAEHVQVVNSGLDRIQTTVRQLLDFAKNTPLTMQSVTVDTIIRNVLHLSDYYFARRGVSIETDFADNLPALFADANKLEQVLLNLILNAIQAMDSGGILTIRTRLEGTSCVITISDSGHGIPPDVISRIFDPFFSTKDVGAGTGLGLTVSKAIIEQHHGHISAASSEQGTVFTITLPIES